MHVLPHKMLFKVFRAPGCKNGRGKVRREGKTQGKGEREGIESGENKWEVQRRGGVGRWK